MAGIMSTTKAHREGARARKRKQGWRTAEGSDIHELYELSVQDPDNEIADRGYRVVVDVNEQARLRVEQAVIASVCSLEVVFRE